MSAHVANRDRYQDLFVSMLEEGIESGDFASQDPALSVMAIMGMCNSVVRWYRPGGKRTAEEIASEFAALAVRGASAERPRVVTALGVPL
jgi:hypothetical protein